MPAQASSKTMAYGATKDVENAQADADEAALAAALGKRQGALKVVAIGLVAAAFVLGYVAAPAGRRTVTVASAAPQLRPFAGPIARRRADAAAAA